MWGVVVSIYSSSGPWFGLFLAVLFVQGCFVSIPSSSGPGFGQIVYGVPDLPYFVSIPSSSGPGFGLRCSSFIMTAGTRSFNPLFIGAWVRTCIRARTRVGQRRFNPLFIGAWVRTKNHVLRNLLRAISFQSPLHRGLGSDREICKCH